MNETLKTILSRRSIRKFQPEQIKDEELSTILMAGQYAPTAMNDQPWHIVAIQNKEVFHKLIETFRAAYLKSGNPRFEAAAKADDFNPFYNAPTYIMVFCDKNAFAPINDGSLAIGNMLLAAESLGLGGIWLHAMTRVFTLPESKAFAMELGVPEGYVPVGGAAFGYKAVNSPDAAPRKEGTVTVFK